MSNDQATDELLKSHPGLSRLLGWCGLATLALGYIATLLGKIFEVKRYLFEAVGPDRLLSIHFGMAFGVAALFIFGYLILAVWVYRRYFRQLEQRKRRLFGGAVTACGLLFAGCSVYAVLPPPPDVRELLDRESSLWEKELLSLAVHGGGIRGSRADQSGEPQVWSTAQSLTGIMFNRVIDQPTLPAAQVLDEQALDAQTVALLMRDLQELDQQESMAQNVLRERTPENVLPVAPPPATAGPDPSQALEENAHRISRPVPITRPEEHNDPPFASGSSLLPASSPRPREVGISPDVAPYFGPASIPDVPKTRLRWIISAGVAAGLSAVVALAFYLGPFRLSISTANSTAVARPPETPLTIPPVTEKQPVAPATAQTTVARTPSSITTAPVPTPIARAASLPAPERARRATVKASGMNWVSACSDGQAAFAGLLSAGDVRDIDFQRTAVIRVGNAAAAEIDVNGKSIGSLGPPGAVKILEISGAGLRFLPVNLSPEAECQPKP